MATLQSDGSEPRGAKLFVSFSGIDGSGKTTQIDSLTCCLAEAGLRVHIVKFWDDVAMLRRLREQTGHRLFKGDRGVGAPGKPVRRRDKNVHSWYMTPLRLALCSLDAVSLAIVTSQLRRNHDVEVIIFDRYLYDQCANLNIGNRLVRIYLQLLLRLVPQPHIAYLLDADPKLASERKPEYPIDFLHRNRAAYLSLSKIAGMSVISPGAVEEVEASVRRELLRKSVLLQHPPVVEIATNK